MRGTVEGQWGLSEIWPSGAAPTALPVIRSTCSSFNMLAPPPPPETEPTVSPLEQHYSRKRHSSECDFRGSGKNRRLRTNFSEEQASLLEEAFQASHYPDQNAKKSMAVALDIPEDRITVWFQNRRAKWRRKELRDKEKARGPFLDGGVHCGGPLPPEALEYPPLPFDMHLDHSHPLVAIQPPTSACAGYVSAFCSFPPPPPPPNYVFYPPEPPVSQ